MHHLAGADADHYVVRLVVAALEKMDVVGSDQTEPEFLRELRQHGVALLLHLDPVVVHLEEKIVRTEDVAKFSRALPRLREIVRLDRHVDLAFEAAAQPDQSGGMFRQEFLIDPRLVVEAVEVRDRDHFYQVAIPDLVFRQESEMVGGVALVRGAIFHRARRHVGFATDDRL